MSWHVIQTTATTTHVYPLGDLIDHDASSFGACVCGPHVHPVTVRLQPVDSSGRETGPSRTQHVAWAIEHHSLDGREAREC